MAKISAIPIPHGDKEFVGPTYAQFKLTGFMGNPETGIMLSPLMATFDEVDLEVNKLIKEAEKAGRAAKKILEKSKKARHAT